MLQRVLQVIEEDEETSVKEDELEEKEEIDEEAVNSNIKSSSDTGIFKSRVGYFKYFMLIIPYSLYGSLSELNLSLDSHIVTTYSTFIVLKEEPNSCLKAIATPAVFAAATLAGFLSFQTRPLIKVLLSQLY